MISIIYYAYRFLYEGLPLVLVCLPIYIYLRLIYLNCRRKKRLGPVTNIMREYAMLLFAVYLMLIFTQTYITNSGDNEIKLIPFEIIITQFVTAVIDSEYADDFIFNVFGNLAVFIPIGIMSAYLWDDDLKKTAEIGLFISFMIEAGQLPLDRTTDVDDLFLNTAGAVTGFFIRKIFIKLKKKKNNKLPCLK